MPPGEVSGSSVSSVPHSSHVANSVKGTYLPSAFVGQPVGIDQLESVWVEGRGATSYTTCSADLMYGTRAIRVPHIPTDPGSSCVTVRLRRFSL